MTDTSVSKASRAEVLIRGKSRAFGHLNAPNNQHGDLDSARYVSRREFNVLTRDHDDLRTRHVELQKRCATAQARAQAERGKRFRDVLELREEVKHLKQIILQIERSTEEIPEPSSTLPLTSITSSQTTINDEEGDRYCPRLSRESSTRDQPVIVSTRIIKRKRASDNDPHDRPPSQRIKREPLSSPSVELVSQNASCFDVKLHQLPHASTSDLDAVGSPIATPRRPRSSHGPWNPSNSGSETKNPSFQGRITSSFSDREIRTTRGSPEKLNCTDRGTCRILRPISGNVPVSATATKRGGISRSRLGDKLAILSEDGGNGVDHVVKPSDPRDERRRRLDAILGKEASQKPSPTLGTTPSRNLSRSKDNMLLYSTLHVDRTGNPSCPESGEESSRRPMANMTTRSSSPQKMGSFAQPRHLMPTDNKSSSTRLKHELSPSPLKLEGRPLRAHPLSALCLEHFKINPKSTGSTFAFADTLRGRDARRSLHSCTMEDCCGGAFRKAIEIGGPALSGTSDAVAMEQFLGPDWTNVLAAYEPARRRELMVQAHVQAFAQKNGKHKQAFNRRTTPPGFWRTDMPDTQEIENDQAKSLELEKMTIEERWREALRPGGRWMFKDE